MISRSFYAQAVPVVESNCLSVYRHKVLWVIYGMTIYQSL